MHKTIIIDDEAQGRKTLKWLIDTYCPELAVVGMASSVPDAIVMIEELNPVLIFLDIGLGAMNGFDLLEKIKTRDFEVVFVTAYQDYAIKAFEFSALHYLLKPVSPDKLKEAVSRLLNKENISGNIKQIEALVENLQKYNHPTTIAIPTNKGLEILKLDEIVRCEGEGNYSNIFLSNSNKILTSKNLKELENMLAGSCFFRIHRKHIVNLKHVTKYISGRGGKLQTTDGVIVDVSRDKKENLLERLKIL
ncbi:MAG: LytTR family DNA-binding domain-containing protein [Bacteroidota bacterium]